MFDACDGDSGGPLIINGGSPGADLQVGIVSWGKAVSCGQPGKPGVYTNLLDPEISYWLQSVIGAAAPPAAPPAQQQLQALSTTNTGPAQQQQQQQVSMPATAAAASPLTAPGAFAPDVPGFNVLRELDLGAHNDMGCQGSLWAGGCQLDGSAQYLAGVCLQIPGCSGFEYLPSGYGARPIPTGFLKTGPVDTSLLTDNGFTALYLMQQTPQQQPAPAVPPYQAGAPAAAPGFVAPAAPSPSSADPFASLLSSPGTSSPPVAPPQAPVVSNPFVFASDRAALAPAPAAPGFDLLAGRDLTGTGDYSCQGSLWSKGCQLQGPLPALARRCLDDPQCAGFVYVPPTQGSGADGNAFLKRGPLDLRKAAPNPATTIYVKQPQVAPVQPPGSGAANTTLQV